jgi:hypothetical protein
VRSEAALPLLSKYKKVSILTTGVLTPKYHAMVAKQYDKFKYCFRIHGEAKNLVGEIFANFAELKAKHGFNNLFIVAAVPSTVSPWRCMPWVLPWFTGSAACPILPMAPCLCSAVSSPEQCSTP